MQRHGAEMDQLRRAQKTQMAAAQMGLERAIGCLRPVVGWWSALVNWFCALVRAGESGW